jgi:hypothetical protein
LGLQEIYCPIKRVPSEKLARDLTKGELSRVTLTKKTESYTGVGIETLVKRQEEKIVIQTRAADAGIVKRFIKGVMDWGKQEAYEDITFHLDRLPGGQSNNPTLSLTELENQDALEQLYVRAQRLTEFDDVLEACYAHVCKLIQSKMISVVNGRHGW